MRFELHVDMDSDAFWSEEEPATELMRILGGVTREISEGSGGDVILDKNGEQVGSFTVSD